MKHKFNLQLIESMILSSKVVLTEYNDPCVFPVKWDQTLGNKFRDWFRQIYPQEAARIKLDATGPYNNETMRKAFCYRPYANETAGSQFMKIDAEQGGGDSDWQLLGLNGWQWLGIMAAFAVVGGYTYIKFMKLRTGIKLAKEVRRQAKNYPGGRVQLYIDALRSVKDPVKRQEFLAKFKKSENISKAEEEAVNKAMLNPGTITEETKFLRSMALQDFKDGKITAEELIRINKLTGADAEMVRDIERSRLKSANPGKTKTTKKYKTIPGTGLTYYSGAASKPNVWFHIKGTATIDEINTAINRNFSPLNLSFKDKIVYKNDPKLQPENIAKLLSGSGKYMLATHFNNKNAFPSFNEWMIAMNRSGAKPQVSPGDMPRYFRDMAIWRIIHPMAGR